MATHSVCFTWRIAWTEEPGGLRPTGSQKVGHRRAQQRSGTSYRRSEKVGGGSGAWVPLRKSEPPGNMELLVFTGWVISYTNKWEDYSVSDNRWGFPGIGGIAHFLAFFWSASGPSWCLWACPLADVLQ